MTQHAELIIRLETNAALMPSDAAVALEYKAAAEALKEQAVEIERLRKDAALVAARERERLFGKERDGDMRLMMHRWQGGKCWAEAIHFPAEQTRFGPSGVLDRAVAKMSMNIDAAIRALNTEGEGNDRP